jgi:hypothetical protein
MVLEMNFTTLDSAWNRARLEKYSLNKMFSDYLQIFETGAEVLWV